MDIREILQSLSPEDRLLWSQCRTEMRRTYLNAHNQTMGIASWDHTDDAFLDMIDIKLAILFDRSGKIVATKQVIGDASEIEEQINATKIIGNGASKSQDLLPVVNQPWGLN